MNQDIHVLKVWGDLACFTRPEMKVERFSYPFITPSAARGIFDAIYCKPKEFRWQITKIEILKPINYIALKRNEVKEKAPNEKTILKWMKGDSEPIPIWADGDRELTGADTKGRTQRQTMALKNVSYQIYGQIVPWSGFENRIKALNSQFQRRALNGKCIYQPYLGCREFPAFFELIDSNEKLATAIDPNLREIGWMLYDVFDLSRPGSNVDQPYISLFRPKLTDGSIDVPPYESEAVFKSGRVN